MPGMSTGLNTNNPTVVAAFQAELLHQALVVLILVGLAALVANFLRARGADTAATVADHLAPEPAGRRMLRIGFGLLWVFDGGLQAQSSMPLGMAPEVIRPAAAASPTWVQHLDNALATVWSYHPVTAPAAAVWIQVGIGLWLLVAPRGRWSRLAGLASVAWGLVVWVFGEAFGGILAPGLTWLFGAPGAALLYCVAGALVALPDASWATPRLGRRLLGALGAFFVGMAVLQAWPGRGFWQGRLAHGAGAGTGAGVGSLTAMAQEMAQTPQPHLLSSWVADFASFDAAHGWGVNLFAVVALAAIGAGLLSGRRTVLLWSLGAAGVCCLADWVLIEDFGFLGGVGTDPNSMIPMLVLLAAGYLAVTRPATAPGPAVTPITAAGAPVPWRARVAANPRYRWRALGALVAVGVTLVGAAPMAAAATDPNADPILAEAVDGPPAATDVPAPPFHLVDQHGRPVSLRGLAGTTVALTILDPVCTSDCPTIAQEFRRADQLLGPAAAKVTLVAVNANPVYTAPAYLQAFDRQEDLQGLANWHYLTGTPAELRQFWKAYGFEDEVVPGGAMVDHSEFAYVIGPSGRTRYIVDTDPGPGTEATQSSFAVTLADAVRQAGQKR